ncbi:endonuclease [Thermogymnomonas acidicola]|uniref:Flap endonuclease 1 n=1 Tax=Thermogymnomonas acidicola TaxID=399579 RepID=A0AA37F9T5_9ARCH|nr:flap endonuclease-1 [Thermogymnomonas acidicola]GGM76085.1 endonuclease [Thermogymnomonas acidicola]
MGVDLGEIVVRSPTTLKEHSGQTVSVDAYNIIYQFLSSIRGPNGEPLRDSQGRVTSHLSGLFYRTVNLLESGIRPVFVFDGRPFELKARTLEERAMVKARDLEAYQEAVEAGDAERARSLASRINYITDEIVQESKALLGLMGLPVVQAPSEGEAQASYMSRAGLVYGVISQDYDCLLFGARRVLRNFTVSGRRRVPGKNVYQNVSPEVASLEETLRQNGITYEQLVDIGIMVGTDFNSGLSRVGAKTALKLVKKYGDITRVLEARGEVIENLDRIRSFFLDPPHVDTEIRFGRPDREGILRFLCGEHDFSRERVEPYLDTIEAGLSRGSQSSLDTFF